MEVGLFTDWLPRLPHRQIIMFLSTLIFNNAKWFHSSHFNGREQRNEKDSLPQEDKIAQFPMGHSMGLSRLSAFAIQRQ